MCSSIWIDVSNGLPGILLLICWCKATCLQITPDDFFNTAPKQCRRRQELLCPSLSIISFTSKNLQLFFIHFQLFFVYVCFSTSQVWNCQKFPFQGLMMWKNFSEIFVVGIDATPNSSNHHGPDAAVPKKKHGSWLIGDLQPKSCSGCSEEKKQK